MTVVIDARESGSSTGRYIDKLIEHLHKLNPPYKITILTKAHRVDFFKSLAPNFDVVEINFKEFTLNEQTDYLKFLKSLNADLVHFGKTEQPVLYKGASVTTVHDLTNALFSNRSRYRNPIVFKFKQFIYRWVIKRVAKKSKFIITPSNFVKNQLADFAHINKDKITVTYEAADFINDNPEAYTPIQGKSFLMYTGRPTPHKNLERLIDAFEIIQKSQKDLYLVLVGKKDANYERIEESVKARNIPNIVFTDFVSDGQLRWLYENTIAYVSPSLSEGFGLPGIEAMMHGAPVISSNSTCLPEVYGEASKYFNPTDVNDIAKVITEVINDPKLRDELVGKGKVQASKYSWDKMVNETLEVYKKALAS